MSFSKESQTSRPVEGHFLPRRPRPHRTLSSLRYDGDEVPVLIRLSELSWQPAQHHQSSGVSPSGPSAAAANPMGTQPAGYVVPAAPLPGDFRNGLAPDDRRTQPSLTPDHNVPGPMLTAASSGSIPTAVVASLVRSNPPHGSPFMTIPGPSPGASPFVPSVLPPQAAAASVAPFQEAAAVAYPTGAHYAPGPAYAIGPAYAGVHPSTPGSGPGALAGQFVPPPLAGGHLPGAERMLPAGNAGIGLVPAGVHSHSPAMPEGWQMASPQGVSSAGRVAGALGPAYPPVLSQDAPAVGVSAGGDSKSAVPQAVASQPAVPLSSWGAAGSPLASVLPMTPGATLGGGMPPLPGTTSPASLADVYREVAGQGGTQPHLRAVAGSTVGQAIEPPLPTASAHSPTLFSQATLAAVSPPGAAPPASISSPVLSSRETGMHAAVGRDGLMPSSSERPGLQPQPASPPGGSEAAINGVLASSHRETTTTQPAAVKAGVHAAAKNWSSGSSKAEALASATKFMTTQGASSPGATASSVSSTGSVSSIGTGNRVAAEAGQTVAVQSEEGETKSHSAYPRDNTRRRQRKQENRKAEQPAQSHTPTSSTDSGKTGASLLGEWDRSKTALALLLAFVSGFAFWTLQGRIFRGESRQDAMNQTAATAPSAATSLRTTQELPTELGPSEQHSPAHAFAPAGRDERTLSSGMTRREGYSSDSDSPAATFPRLRSVQLLDESRVESPPRVRFAKPEANREESATGWPEEEGAADRRSLRSQGESSSGGAGSYIIEAASSQDDAVQGWPDEPTTQGKSRSSEQAPWETKSDRSSASEGGRSQETFRTSRLETEPVRGDTRSGAEVQDGSGLQGTIEIPRARASQERHGSHLY